jgi:hypothetical protein
VKRRQVVVALPARAEPVPAAATAKPAEQWSRSAPTAFDRDRLVSPDALEQVREVAPGWDKYYLEAAYKEFVSRLGEMPRNPDRAFLGWARKFTKGKRPS